MRITCESLRQRLLDLKPAPQSQEALARLCHDAGLAALHWLLLYEDVLGARLGL